MRKAALLLLAVCITVSFLLYLPLHMYCQRYLRMAAIKDCNSAQTQTVTVGFLPTRLRWKLTTQITGNGRLIIPGAFSNSVSGKVHASGEGDYYDTNASLIFIPNGPVSGSVEASFRFSDSP